MTAIGVPAGVRRAWAEPDAEPVDVDYLSPAVRASWITDALVKELAE